MRLVLDTNVIIRAIRSPEGVSAALVAEALRGVVRPLISTTLGLEYEAVVLRPEHWVAGGFDQHRAEGLLARLADVSEPVDIAFKYRGILPDPDDEMVIEAAMNGQADALVTFNARHFVGVAPYGLAVCDPMTILGRLRRH